MFCENCGTQIPDNAKFCPKCGGSAASASKNRKQVKKPKAVVHPAYQVPYNIGNFGMLAGIVMAIAGWFISNDLGGILGEVWNRLSRLLGGSTSMFGILKTVLTGESSDVIFKICKEIDRVFDTSFWDITVSIAFVGIIWVIFLIGVIYWALVKNIRGLTYIYVLNGMLVVFLMCTTIVVYSLFGQLTDVSEGIGFNVFMIGSIVILVSFFIEIMLDRNAILKQKNRFVY